MRQKSSQMRQKICNAECRLILFFTDADLDQLSVLFCYNAVDRQRHGSPLIFADAAVVMGLKISDIFLFIERIRL